jgi:hypothetical protein
MNRGLTGFVFSILLLSAVLPECDRNQPELKIGILGDQTGTYQMDSAYHYLQTAVTKILAWQPDLIIQVGDIFESIRGVDSLADFRRQFEKIAQIVHNSNLPWLIALGDHDVNPPQYRPLSKDRSREAWLQQLAREFELPFAAQPYYSLDYKGYHFVALYSLENLHTDPRWGSIFLNGISGEQLAWLKSDLEAHKKTRGIIVVVHHPHWYVWSNWSAVHALLRQYPVKAVVAGHFHYDQDEGELDGIRYLVMGATGGVIKNCDAHSGGAQEYGLMQITKAGKIAVELREVRSDTLLEWTPRKTMDRIQALQCMLDNLWSDNRLQRKNQSISNVNRPASRQIMLKSLGNPIDIPIKVVISFEPQLVKDPHWLMGKDTLNGDETITLPPGERILWANYSNIGSSNSVGPLWEATLQKSIPKTIQAVTLSITVSFLDDRQRYVRSNLQYNLE